ncbi:MAG: repeat protein [Pseudomonas sp.]|nr:repeat protein [Pseudomonas sp.]
MQSNRENLRCHYRYDPLDRLTAHTPSKQVSNQHFYLKDRLATRIQGAEQHSIMQHENLLLAQQQHQTGLVKTQLLATDQQRSVLNVLDASLRNCFAYTPYGHRAPENGLLSLLGFNGERPDPLTGHYLLGNGYRAFNPVLMRFNSPDSWSPFGEGGFNGYTYCVGDPVNRSDPTGHRPKYVKNPLNTLKHTKKTINKALIQELVPPTSIQKQDSLYELVGFHGTSPEYAQTIPQTGLDPKFIKRVFYGDGFYTTPSMSKALGYTEGGRAGDPFANNPNGMLAIYVKAPTDKIQGQHYTFHPGHNGALDELLLLPEMYNDVKIIPFIPTGAEPELNLYKIFKIRSGKH